MPKNTDKSGNKTDEHGIVTDKYGKWVKGTKSPNPRGRNKLTGIQKYLRQAAGEVTEDLFNILIEISTYDQIMKNDKWEKVKTSEKIKAIELLLAYAHGRPTQHVEAQVETKSINVEVKLPEDIEAIDI